MKKLIKVFVGILLLTLCFTIFAPLTFADVDVPEIPNTEGMNVDDANALIENYNSEVDIYNSQVQEEYENQLAQTTLHNQEEDQKVAENAQEIASAEQQNADILADYEEAKAEADAVNAQEDEKVEESQKAIDEANAKNEELSQQIDAAEQHNAEEDQKVENSQAELAIIEDKIEGDADVVEHHVEDAADAPTDWSDTTQDAKTISVISSETPTGDKISVINIHTYIDGDSISGNLYDSIGKDTFTLAPELLKDAIFIEWETVEIDVDDTVVIESEAGLFTDNTIRHDGKNYRLQPYYNYFIRNIEGYTQGYWLPSGMIAMTATDVEYGWGYDFSTGEGKAGDTYTIHYGETEKNVNYLEDGVLKTEQVTVRTTDGEAPKNIFALFVYTFTRLWEEPVEYTPEYVEVPTLVDVPEAYVPQYVSVDPPTYVTVPEVYQPNYLQAPEQPTLLTKLDYLAPVSDPVPTVTPDPVIEIVESEDLPIEEEKNIEPDFEIHEDPEVPLAGIFQSESWALVNLITLVLTILSLIKIGDRGYTVFSPISVISSLVLFILTENVYNPMIMVDRWTVWMIVIFVIAILSRVFAKKDKKESPAE